MGGAIILKLSAHNRHIVSFLKMQKTWAISHNSNPNTKSKPLRHFNKIPDDSVMGNERTTLVSVQFSSVTQSCLTLCDHMDCSTPGFPVHHQLPELTQTHVHWVSDAIQSSHPLSSPSPPAFNLSQHQGLFRWVSSSHRVAKYWSFSLRISPYNSGLISFRMDWLDLLAVCGPLKSLQHHSSKHQFFIAQLSYSPTSIHDYWKNHNFD